MDIESLRDYCLSKKGATEGLPFGPTVVVFKAVKMFALVPLDTERAQINLKCDPEWAEELRAEHPEITPGFHMNKTHWNTVECETGLSATLIKKLIDHSHEIVVAGLSKKEKAAFDAL